MPEHAPRNFARVPGSDLAASGNVLHSTRTDGRGRGIRVVGKKACDAIRAARPWTHVAVVVGTDPDEAFRITFSNGHDGTLEDARDAWNKLRKFGSLELPVHPNHVIRGFVHDRSVLGEVPANLARIRSAILTCAKTT